MVSGGQTGVDRAAFDVALAWGVPIRGWVPAGRKDEYGEIDSKYENLRETNSDDNDVRTFLNVRDSDGTLIIAQGQLEGGSLRAAEYACHLNRPLCVVTLSNNAMQECIEKVLSFLRDSNIRHLNVGGPRESEDAEIYGYAVQLMSGLLSRLNHEDGSQSAHVDIALAMFADAAANFRHWDQIRWIVPTWFLTVFAGLAALSSLETRAVENSIRLGSLLFAIFGMLYIGLEINLIFYHNAAIRSLRGRLGQLTLDRQSRDVLVDMSLPFAFSFGSIWRTATVWFVLAMFGVVAICLLIVVIGPWWVS